MAFTGDRKQLIQEHFRGLHVPRLPERDTAELIMKAQLCSRSMTAMSTWLLQQITWADKLGPGGYSLDVGTEGMWSKESLNI